ncbi:MAG: GNAT family N-acetyltransferase [Thermodesulfobacteriota bacterium]
MADFQYFTPLVVQVLPATADQAPILANLFQLYMHDFSEFVELEPGADGRFREERLISYWQEADRHPYLVLVSGNLAGFALIKEGSEISGAPGVWDMAEFFILRGRRRLGIGMKAALELWKKHPGEWEIRVRERNNGAIAFWAGAVKAFSGRTTPPKIFHKEGIGWQVFSFKTG